MEKIYMMVTKDELELPVAIAETITELSEITGRSISAIRASISKQKNGKIKKSTYIYVILDE